MKNDNTSDKIKREPKKRKTQKDSIQALLDFLSGIQKFRDSYLKEHPECSECEFLELADDRMYKDLREIKCKQCPHYKGW